MSIAIWVLVLAPYAAGALMFAERKRIVEWISNYVTDAVYSMLQDQLKAWLIDDRGKTVEVLRPLMKELIDELLKEYQKNPPAEAGERMIKLPIIGKVPLSMVMSFLGKTAPAAEKAVEENPFA